MRPRARDTRWRDAPARWALLIVTVAFAAGLLIAGAAAEPRRAGTNGVFLSAAERVGAGALVCQSGEQVPAGASVLKVTIRTIDPRAPTGPDVIATIRVRGRTVGRGAIASGWSGLSATIPLTAATAEHAGADVCLRVGDAAIGVVGSTSPHGRRTATVDGAATGLAMRIDYLRDGSESTAAFLAEYVERIAAAHGGWSRVVVGGALAGALLAAWALAGLVLVRTVVSDRARMRARTVACLVAAIGALNAAAWSVLTPPLQVPDEPTHFAYVQTIAETGRLPVETERPRYSPELRTVMRAVHVSETRTEYRIAAWTPTLARGLAADETRGLARVGDGSAKASNPEPPLYYALAAIPYRIGQAAPMLDRLALVRLLGALFAGVTALICFAFVRECLPGRPWAWSIGGLCAAFAPMVGYVSGGANPDALLFPVSAALFYAVARAFRRGLSPAWAVWAGVAIAIGMLAKINFYGLVPGALLALALAARASAGGWNRRALRLIAIVVAVGLGPYVLMHVADALVWDRANILWKDTSAASADRGGILDQLGFLWTTYLPPLPWQDPPLPGVYIGYDRWFKTFAGAFGGNVVVHAAWGYRVALAACLAVVALAGRAAFVDRRALADRRAELLGYAAMAGGLLLVIALVALRGWAPDLLAAAQGRYLVPLLALCVALVALAVRGAGERWGRAVGVVLVAGAVAWSLFGQLITVQHFYG